MEYKPGLLNVVAGALSRRPDFESGAQSNREALPTVAALSVILLSSSLFDDVRKAYAGDTDLLRLMGQLAIPSRNPLSDFPALYRSCLDRYTSRNGLLYYIAVADDTPRVVVRDHADLRCASCWHVTMRHQVGIAVGKRLTLR